MKIESVAVASLKPLEKNVRYHTEVQVKEFMRALEQFGQTRPFVIDEDNNVLVGNGMLMAMQRAGWKKADALRMKGLSDSKKKKLVLSDNRIFNLGGDNADNIESIIREIAAVDDLDIAGFDADVLHGLIRDAEEVAESVMSYGTVDDDTLKSVTSTPRAKEPEPEQPPVQTAETVKTVVCPSCGEVIRL